MCHNGMKREHCPVRSSMRLRPEALHQRCEEASESRLRMGSASGLEERREKRAIRIEHRQCRESYTDFRVE